MKNLLFLIMLISISINLIGQTQAYIDQEIIKIKSIPTKYQKGQSSEINKDVFTDKAYLNIKRLDTSAIPFLINKLTDTTYTSIDNTCLLSKLKIPDLAFFLINDIELIPYHLVTGGQYCTWNECGVLPDGFLNFINTQRLRFKNDYSTYYYGPNRAQWLMALKGLKNKISF